MDLELVEHLRGRPDDACVAHPARLSRRPDRRAVLFAVIARRSRDLTTAVLTLMAVAIAINIAVGSIAVALRLPIYLNSIGTVLVGALAGPWAGALTGILSNLIWSILPMPGGAGPTAAFFAPVAGVIGLMAGFWAAEASSSSGPTTSGSAASSPSPRDRRRLRRVPGRPGDDRHPEPRVDRSGRPDPEPVVVPGHRDRVDRRRRRRRLDLAPDRLRVHGPDPRSATTSSAPRRSLRSRSSSRSCACCSARPATSRRSTASTRTARRTPSSAAPT